MNIFTLERKVDLLLKQVTDEEKSSTNLFQRQCATEVQIEHTAKRLLLTKQAMLFEGVDYAKQHTIASLT